MLSTLRQHQLLMKEIFLIIIKTNKNVVDFIIVIDISNLS